MERWPEKKMMKTDLYSSSPVCGSRTRWLTSACRRYMLPRVTRKTTRSKLASFARAITPATYPSRVWLSPVSESRAEPRPPMPPSRSIPPPGAEGIPPLDELPLPPPKRADAGGSGAVLCSCAVLRRSPAAAAAAAVSGIPPGSIIWLARRRPLLCRPTAYWSGRRR